MSICVNNTTNNSLQLGVYLDSLKDSQTCKESDCKNPLPDDLYNSKIQPVIDIMQGLSQDDINSFKKSLGLCNGGGSSPSHGGGNGGGSSPSHGGGNGGGNGGGSNPSHGGGNGGGNGGGSSPSHGGGSNPSHGGGNGRKKLTSGDIAGIVIGSIAGIILIILLSLLVIRKIKK